MPQRFLRPGITTSSRWNSVCWQAQSLYIRVITQVDDYGRCDGRASVIHGHCLSVWNELNPAESCDLQRTAALLSELERHSLIETYESEGKKVLQVTQWQERIRDGAKERWPSNTNPQRSAATRSVPLPSSTTTTTPTAPPSPPISNRENVALSLPMTKNGKATIELMERCKRVLGDKEMSKCHRRWVDRATKEPGKLDRVLNDMERHVKDGGAFTKSPGARAETLWKEFK